jgi:hypothetical protein
MRRSLFRTTFSSYFHTLEISTGSVRWCGERVERSAWSSLHRIGRNRRPTPNSPAPGMANQGVHANRVVPNTSHRRRRIGIGSVVALGAIAGMAAMAGLLIEIPRLSSSPQARSPVPNVQLGIILRQTDKEQCTVAGFDNDTGRTVDLPRHCENNIAIDAQGVPAPAGTIRRLDSISKSFMGTNH